MVLLKKKDFCSNDWKKICRNIGIVTYITEVVLEVNVCYGKQGNKRVYCDDSIEKISWDRAQEMWSQGEKNFYRLYGDNTLAMVRFDRYHDLAEHHYNGGEFGIDREGGS